MNAAPHWAADLIGAPYRRGAEGPDAFDCWSFVRHVFRTQYGIEMPPVKVGRAGDEAETQVAAIKRAAKVSGWRPIIDSPPQDRDIALMDSADGRHVGVMILVDGSVKLLHCMNPVGVCCQTYHEAHIAGFWRFEYWRHQ